MNYHSQHGEDKWIAENLQLPKKGVFVEVGAYDGILSSNTFYFENKGWTGLIIEPDKEIAAASLLHRRCDVACCAVGNNPGRAQFFVNDADRGLSGLTRPGRAVEVTVARLSNLIETYSINQIDLLSIDTEGTELDVWDSLMLHRYIYPTVVIMEWSTLGMPSNEEAIMHRIAFDDYKLVHKTDCNLIFTR